MLIYLSSFRWIYVSYGLHNPKHVLYLCLCYIYNFVLLIYLILFDVKLHYVSASVSVSVFEPVLAGSICNNDGFYLVAITNYT